MVIDLNRPHGLWEGPVFNYAGSKASRVAGGLLASKLSYTLVVNYR